MKRLIFAVVALAVVWSGYWFFQAQSLRGNLENWFEARRGDGWEASYSDLAIRGFPNRVDVTFTDLLLANPENGTVWEAPYFQMLSLVYDPEHWIFVWPESQSFGTKRGLYDINSEGMRASFVADDKRILRSNLEAATLNVAGPSSFALAGLAFGIAADETRSERLRIGFSARAVAANAGALARVGSGTIDELALRAEVDFDEIWTTDALKDRKPQPTRINLPLAQYRADDLELKITADWDVDRKGRLDGSATLRAVNWRELLDDAGNTGQLPEGLSDFLAETLGLVAQLSGNRKTLDLTFTFNEGRMSLGIIPLGNAPRVRLK